MVASSEPCSFSRGFRTPSRTATPSYSEKLNIFIQYWFNDIECQNLRNNINNLTNHQITIEYYRTSLTPTIQNKLKKFLFDIDEHSHMIDKTITYDLKKDLHSILNACNNFSVIEGANVHFELAKDLKKSWNKLIASIQNLYSCVSVIENS